MPFAAYPQERGDDWPINGFRAFQESLVQYDGAKLLEEAFADQESVDHGDRVVLGVENDDLIFQPFGPAEYRYDLKTLQFFPIYGEIEKIPIEDLSLSSFLIGASSGVRKFQLLDLYKDQPWFCHDRILITIDRADRPPGHLILLLAKRSSVIDLWQMLQALRSVLFITEQEMDKNLAIDIFENRITLDRYHMMKEENGLVRWDYIQPKNLTWMGSIVSDEWNIGKPEWEDLSVELRSRARHSNVELPTIESSPRAFGTIRMTSAIREAIPFSSVIKRTDVSVSGMPELNQIIFSTGSRNNKMDTKNEMSRLRQKLMWGKTAVPITMLWTDEFMLDKWPGLNSILYQTIPRTGQVMLFSPTLRATLHLLHVFYQLCVDELTFTLTRFLSSEITLNHRGDFITFFQNKVSEFYDRRLAGSRIFENWNVFLKGFISIEGWFVSFYLPTIKYKEGKIATEYPYPVGFEDFSMKYREQCLNNKDPNDVFFHSIKFTTNGEAYKQFVKANPSSAVQSKDKILLILPMFGKYLKEQLSMKGVAFFEHNQAIQRILTWRKNLVKEATKVDLPVWHKEGLNTFTQRHWTLMKPFTPVQVLHLLDSLPEFHQRMSWENWTSDKDLPAELFYIPEDAIRCALRHMCFGLYKKISRSFTRASLLQGSRVDNQRVYDLISANRTTEFEKWGDEIANWPASEPAATLKAVKRLIPNQQDKDRFETILTKKRASFETWLGRLDELETRVPALLFPIDLTIQSEVQWQARKKAIASHQQNKAEYEVWWNIVRRSLTENLHAQPRNAAVCAISTLTDDDPSDTEISDELTTVGHKEETSPTESMDTDSSPEKTMQPWLKDAGAPHPSIINQIEFLIRQDKTTDTISANFINRNTTFILSHKGEAHMDPMLLRMIRGSLGAKWLRMTKPGSYFRLLDFNPEGLQLKAQFDLALVRDPSPQESVMPGAARIHPVFYAGSPSEELNIKKDTYQMALKHINRKYIVFEASVDQGGLTDWQARDIQLLPILTNNWIEGDFQLRENEKSKVNESPSGMFFQPNGFHDAKFNWEKYVVDSTLTIRLCTQPAKIKGNWENICEMLNDRDILPIVVFKSDKDFFVFKLTLDWDSQSHAKSWPSSMLGFIFPRVEEHQFNLLNERFDSNAATKVRLGQCNPYLSILRAKLKTVLDGVCSRFMTMFIRRKGVTHYAMSPSFLNLEMLLSGPGSDTLYRRGDFGFEESVEETLQSALAREELEAVSVTNMTLEHQDMIQDPLQLRNVSFSYHDNMQVAQQVINCMGGDWDPTERNKMIRFKRMIVKASGMNRPQENAERVFSHAKWKELKCLQPQPYVLGAYAPDIRVRPKRNQPSDKWFNQTFTAHWAKPIVESNDGEYATFSPHSHSPFGHAMISLLSMWSECAKTNRVRVALQPSIYRLTGLEPPILEKTVVLNQLQLLSRIRSNEQTLRHVLHPFSETRPNYFFSEDDIYEILAARAKMSQNHEIKGWYRESGSFLAAHNLVEPLLGEAVSKQTQWALLAAESFAADGRQWEQSLTMMKSTARNSQILAWQTKAIERWQRREGVNFTLFHTIFTPEMAFRDIKDVKFVPSSLISWPWGNRMFDERYMWPTKKGRNVSTQMVVQSASLPPEWVCDQLLVFSPAPHRNSNMNKDVARALAVTTITNPFVSWLAGDELESDETTKQAFQKRTSKIDQALTKPHSFQQFKQTIWSLPFAKITTIGRWIELLLMIRQSELETGNNTVEEFCWSDARSSIAVEADALTELAHKIRDLQPTDFVDAVEPIFP